LPKTQCCYVSATASTSLPTHGCTLPHARCAPSILRASLTSRRPMRRCWFDSILEWRDDAGGRPFERIADALATLNLGRRRDEEHNATGLEIEATRVVEIPVCYGDEYGPDLDAVAEHS